MISPEHLYKFLQQKGIDLYTGVPDSLFKSFLKYLQDNASPGQHVITANEGLAIGLASGHYFSTGKMPLIYLQNSGLGNIINPLTSLADKEMYAVPMLLMIGHRGRPGTEDEPQHLKMGRITEPLLKALEIPFVVLEEKEEASFEKIDQAIAIAMKEQKPVAILVPENIFAEYDGVPATGDYDLAREQVIKELIHALKGDETVICTTGKTGREFYEQNKMANHKIKKYFLSVGAMGHANHVGLGISMSSDQKVIVLDGDGALLMQMGSMPTIAHYAKNNFIHIVFNNGSHQSVGAQPTEGFNADLCGIAKASGYGQATCIINEKELSNWLKNGSDHSATQFVEIRINNKSRSDLGRPAGKPSEWKDEFMKALHQKK